MKSRTSSLKSYTPHHTLMPMPMPGGQQCRHPHCKNAIVAPSFWEEEPDGEKQPEEALVLEHAYGYNCFMHGQHMHFLRDVPWERRERKRRKARKKGKRKGRGSESGSGSGNGSGSGSGSGSDDDDDDGGSDDGDGAASMALL